MIAELVERPAASSVDRRHRLRLIDRFLEQARSIDEPEVQAAVEGVVEALSPVERLGRIDPHAARDAEWTLSLSLLEATMLRLVRAVDARRLPKTDGTVSLGPGRSVLDHRRAVPMRDRASRPG